MPVLDGDCLRLTGSLDAGQVPRLAKALPKLPPIRRIDLAGVGEVDSAGVAFVRELQARVERLHGQRPALVSIPRHYRQLCQAHRVACEDA